VIRYCLPTHGAPLEVEPQLASWDAAGTRSQVRLAAFLSHAESVAAPLLAESGSLALQLTVGLSPDVPLCSGGRDLDNYLYPLAQRLGPARLTAVFGRKIHGSSYLAIGPAEPEPPAAPPSFVTRLSGSCERPQWKEALRERLRRAGVSAAPPGPVAMDIAITTGPGRSWPNLWKPLIDAFGPVLGEEPGRPFHPRDDRITALGLHHGVETDLAHDVIIHAWWSTGMPTDPGAEAGHLSASEVPRP
jgi:hypothetical protein